jgi:hypothetical protein
MFSKLHIFDKEANKPCPDSGYDSDDFGITCLFMLQDVAVLSASPQPHFKKLNSEQYV